MLARTIPGCFWSAIALSTGRSNAGMRCAFSNSPAVFDMWNYSRHRDKWSRLSKRRSRISKRAGLRTNDIAELREITDTELVLHDGRRMRRDGARIDQGVCITSHASQCRTVDQVVVLPDGADAKGWYVSLSRARDAMHVYTRNKLELRQSVMQPSERKSVWERLQAFQSSKPQRRDRKMPDLWAARQAEISHDVEMER